MLGALLFCICGWRNEKFLFGIFPAIAIGFMFKSVIALLAVPIIGIYCLCYREWAWLKNEFLWLGLIPASIVLLPWHILQTLKFGREFWHIYIFNQVFERATSTLTGTNNYYDFLNILWITNRPWIWVFVGAAVLFCALALYRPTREKIEWRHCTAPFVTVFFIVAIFTLVRTHLATYILPALPFLAMSIAVCLREIVQILQSIRYVSFATFLFLLVLGVTGSFRGLSEKNLPLIQEEKDIGEIYREMQAQTPAPLTSIDWPQI